MIEVENLVKKYGGHTAVDGLSFKVEKGQIYGFLGPNGAGKSTTMNIITGYIASTEGTVRINGHDILEEPEEAKKCIGYLPEQPPLYFDMTVLEYLKFTADLKKIPKNEQIKMIEEVMEMTKIKDMRDRLIKNLSKGYRQRVGLAQAVLGYPEVIILDEPTVGLDPKQIIEIRELIKGLAKKHTIILSSHILSEVSAVCDYIMIIARGKLVASDTPENLIRRMQSSGSLFLSVKGEKEKLEKVLPAVKGVQSWSYSESGQEGVTDLRVQMKKDEDAREELFYTLADARCPILLMKYEKASLEDVFLELTSDEKRGKEVQQKKGFWKRSPKRAAESGERLEGTANPESTANPDGTANPEGVQSSDEAGNPDGAEKQDHIEAAEKQGSTEAVDREEIGGARDDSNI